MDYQVLFNLTILVVGFLGAWVLKTITSKLSELSKDQSRLKDEIHAVHILVAGQYVRNEALDRFENAVFVKLDRIEEKLSNKQDKE